MEVCTYYARQQLLNIPKRTVQEAYDQLMAAKRAEGCSDKHISDLESRVGKFVGASGTSVVWAVNGSEIKEGLQGLQHSTLKTDPNAPKVPVTNRTRNNFRLCIQALFSFAKGQRYLPGDWSGMDSVPLWKLKDEETEMFTPEEMRLLLALAPKKLAP